MGLGSNLGEYMDVCKCKMPSRHGGSRRAASPLVWLVEGEDRGGQPYSFGGPNQYTNIIQCAVGDISSKSNLETQLGNEKSADSSPSLKPSGWVVVHRTLPHYRSEVQTVNWERSTQPFIPFRGSVKEYQACLGT
ncbi:hypothetical protein TNCV_980771 [Trichonephila clavipes]|uniref:Uncharacterized protein n=1 Tax=Trichonephila clavipes TaxID=2585209 RepID=A0A8X6S557_TRICX|nr:hypothetical protein TNCV_980771 [Trichonephila clavipes]